MKLVLCVVPLCLINFATVQGEGNVSEVANASDLSNRNNDENVPANSDMFTTASSSIITTGYDSTTASSNVTREVTETTTTGPERCKCVYYYYCSDRGVLNDPLVTCDDYLQTCCQKSQITDVPLNQYIPDSELRCGVHHPKGDGFYTPAVEGEAKFGEFPWMVALFITPSSQEKLQANPIVQCGGSLIHPQVVLTGAHCVSRKDAKYTIRAGEWDLQNENESYVHQDRHVKSVIVHPHYKTDVLFNNVALLILETPVKITHNVEVVCLPKHNIKVDELKCFVTGWGKDVSGNSSTILKKLEVATLSHNTCQERLRETRLGKHFILDPSFICAGGEPGVDTCKGDGGGPLVCPIPGSIDRYFQAGIVSWGIGCGEGVPGAYANVPMFVDWIGEQFSNQNFNTSYYKY